MNYKYEFPNFDYEIPELGNDWIDSSWHNDVCPSFEYSTGTGLTYRLWFEYKDPDIREMGGKLFTLSKYSDYDDLTPLFEADNLNEVLEHFNNLQKD
jgi:hypothetical protein